MALGIVYVMLALAILIALMGIANTLSLSVHERTREIGLLRAVGETRRQVRSMVRWESVIVATFGTIGGLGLGLFLGWALVQAASNAEVRAGSQRPSAPWWSCWWPVAWPGAGGAPARPPGRTHGRPGAIAGG